MYPSNHIRVSLHLSCCHMQAEESAPADAQATLQAMHEWSSSIDTPQLLQAMAQGDTAAVQQIHEKASSLVQQLEQQLQQVTEPVAVAWLKASAYDTYALLLRTADWLTGLRDLHAAHMLAELVKVGALTLFNLVHAVPACACRTLLLCCTSCIPEDRGETVLLCCNTTVNCWCLRSAWSRPCRCWMTAQ